MSRTRTAGNAGYCFFITSAQIGQSGCYLTSFAMVANYYYPNAGYNPKTINVLMGDYACGFDKDVAALRTGLTINNYYNRASFDEAVLTDVIAGALVMERPVIIGMKPADAGAIVQVLLVYYYFAKRVKLLYNT